MERLLLARQSLGLSVSGGSSPAVYLVGLGEEARLANMAMAGKLRAAGLRVDLEVEERSFKAQLRSANRSGAAYALVRGEDELNRGVVVLKSMQDGEQRELTAEEAVNFIIDANRK